jgi:RNA polymerase Rpb2, domain 3
MSSPSGDVVYHGVKSSHTGAIITVETPDGEVLGVVRHIAAHSPAWVPQLIGLLVHVPGRQCRSAVFGVLRIAGTPRYTPDY